MSERWKTVGDDFASLKDAFKKRYDQKDIDAEEEAPDSDDVKNALNTIGEGLERLFSSIGDVVRDDDFKSQAKATMKNLGDAISESVQDIGVKTTGRKSTTSSDDPGVSTEAASDNSGTSETDGTVNDNVTTLREDLEEDEQ